MYAAHPEEQGFTLIEMMVALAIFSLAALALLRLQAVTSMNSVTLKEQAVAMMVARNIAAETLTDPMPPAFGDATGELSNGGMKWLWLRRTGRSPEARIQQIEIRVATAGRGAGASLTIFRRAGR
jgi:general secretion pathway protein I